MCREIGMYDYRSVTGISLMIMTWNNSWKHFFKWPAVFFLEHTQDLFQVAVSGATRGKVLKGASVHCSQII